MRTIIDEIESQAKEFFKRYFKGYCYKCKIQFICDQDDIEYDNGEIKDYRYFMNRVADPFLYCDCPKCGKRVIVAEIDKKEYNQLINKANGYY